MEERIKKVMSNVFDIDIAAITENASPDNIEKWDSLKHINLIVALEEEFGFEFNDEEISDLLNYQLILDVVKTKLA
jgi:acyl carrier protein